MKIEVAADEMSVEARILFAYILYTWVRNRRCGTFGELVQNPMKGKSTGLAVQAHLRSIYKVCAKYGLPELPELCCNSTTKRPSANRWNYSGPEEVKWQWMTSAIYAFDWERVQVAYPSPLTEADKDAMRQAHVLKYGSVA